MQVNVLILCHLAACTVSIAGRSTSGSFTSPRSSSRVQLHTSCWIHSSNACLSHEQASQCFERRRLEFARCCSRHSRGGCCTGELPSRDGGGPATTGQLVGGHRRGPAAAASVGDGSGGLDRAPARQLHRCAAACGASRATGTRVAIGAATWHQSCTSRHRQVGPTTFRRPGRRRSGWRQCGRPVVGVRCRLAAGFLPRLLAGRGRWRCRPAAGARG